MAVQYLDKYNVSRQPYKRDVYYYEYTTGQSVDAKTLAAGVDPAAVKTAVQTYLNIWNTYSSYLKPGFPNGIPAALSAPIHIFLARNNLMPISAIFYRVMTLYGYGNPKRVPAVYALVVLTDKVVAGSFGLLSNPVWLADFPLLMTRLADDLRNRGVQFVYNAKISNATRWSGGVSFKYSVGSQLYEEKCDMLVVAFPQTLDAMSFLNLDEQERAVFQEVKVYKYITSLVNTNMNIGSRFYANLLQLDRNDLTYDFGNAKRDGQPIQFARQYPNVSNITTVYSSARSAPWKTNWSGAPVGMPLHLTNSSAAFVASRFALSCGLSMLSSSDVTPNRRSTRTAAPPVTWMVRPHQPWPAGGPVPRGRSPAH